MNNISRVLVIVLISAMFVSVLQAEEYKYEDGKKQGSSLKETTAGCSPASGYDWLDVNNVRARINTGGDMWWDLPGGIGAKYFIPKAGSATSMFSGALWIGGLDINNQLKLAAQRYRQVGIDYWTGPLTIEGFAAVDETTCANYDRFFKITRAMVDDFISHCNPETGIFEPSEDYQIPSEITGWPANGDISKNQSYYLAPFYDNNGDGEYNPYDGDYPYYDITNELCHTDIPTAEEEYEGTVTGSILADQVIKGDQTLWWVFNDKGNIHTETGGSSIGLEIRAQAFGFATNDVINNMTFYSYEIINRSTFELRGTFFCPWVDTDLGYAQDDFVGCDVGRGLGYCYNGKDIDGNGEVESYGAQPPAIGVDFFQGPYMDPDGFDNPGFGGSGDGPRFYDDPSTNYDERCEIVTLDGLVINMPLPGGGTTTTRVVSAAINGVNFGNGIVDDERFGMRRFVYHNNSSGVTGDPQIAPQYYNYLRAIWKDNTKMKFGGTGHLSGQGTTDMDCDFMFPGDSDPCNWGTNGQPPPAGWNQDGKYWTEETGNNGQPNPPADRRFMQSAGPFTLKPGAVNYITVGIPWARAQSGGAYESVELLRVVDDKCQALFDNCFKVIDGPTAPDLVFTELDKQIIVYITNLPTSNNYQEKYAEYDPNIIQPLPGGKDGERSDSMYVFEGYQIFQLANDEVSIESIHDPDLARIVAQFDVKNGVTNLVNYYYDESLQANVPVLEVVGSDNGISHSFVLLQDAFASGDVSLVNNKTYYYLAVAYAYNNYLQYSPGPDGYLGQTKPYLSGRKNIGDKTNGGKPYEVTPHKIVNGTILNSSYGNSPQMTRIAGYGNGGMVLDLTEETVDEIMSKPPAGPDNLFGSPTYPIAYNPTYVLQGGPLNIKVVDPLTVSGANYTWWLDTLVRQRIGVDVDDPAVLGDTTSLYVSNWYFQNNDTKELRKSDTSIVMNYEQLFLDLGLSVDVLQSYQPGPIPVGKVYNSGTNTWNTYTSILSSNNGLLQANITYSDSSLQWLSGVQDSDEPASPLNWIRSGTVKDDNNTRLNDWMMGGNFDSPWDPGQAYEKILGGIWAPYSLTAYGNNFGQGSIQSTVGPAFSFDSKLTNPMSDIASVDIVFTSDKTLWTRAPVLEMGFDKALTEGGVYRFALRDAPSVDKNGNPATKGDGPSENPNNANYISDHGMGWFPGYAINVETGERLNIMFGEDSYLVAQNGRDMLFNPPPRDIELETQFEDNNIWSGTPPNRVPVLGGKHYVYIMKHGSYTVSNGGLNVTFNSPAYDAGRTAVTTLDTLFSQPLTFLTNYFFSNVMYVGIPMGVVGQEWLSNDAKIRIRINKPYKRGYSSVPLDTVYPGMDVNNYYPMYTFSTDGIGSEYNNPSKQTSDLDLIQAVPNPYYAYSAYENNALDTRIKITNLPIKCTITVYNISGTKVRQLTKDSPETAIEWDLKNFASVPISGGMYYIHVQSDAGEAIIKWLCVMRVPDLNTF
ncbi:MAG TPA: hypothetical protein VIN10_05465 [Bacteroidales bacterium]